MDDRQAERPVGSAPAPGDAAAPEADVPRWVQSALASPGPIGDLELLVSAMPALLDLSEVCIQLRAGQVRRSVTGAGSPLACRLEECGPPRLRPSELAVRSGEAVQVSLPDPDHPALSHEAARMGIRAVWSLPLRADGSVFGVMTLYATGAEPWTGTRAGGARRMAQQAERIVGLAAERARLEHMNANLWRALESRTTIGQAQGILMATRGFSPDTAFRHLAQASQDSHRKLRDVAADIVADLTARPHRSDPAVRETEGAGGSGAPSFAPLDLDGAHGQADGDGRVPGAGSSCAR